ncbi:hypothetical protein ScPMuIL_001651 [Solemya velum]
MGRKVLVFVAILLASCFINPAEGIWGFGRMQSAFQRGLIGGALLSRGLGGGGGGRAEPHVLGREDVATPEYTEEIERMRRDLQAAREKNGIFLAEENYNAMNVKIAQQEESIRDLEEKIEAITEEMNKVLELFADTKKDLESTTEQLKVTTDHLEKTAEVLQQTEENLCQTTQEKNEQQHLVMQHATNEEKLYGQASDLLETVESSTSDVSGLQDKLDRKRKVEQHNEDCQETFLKKFKSRVGEMENQIVQHENTEKSFGQGINETFALISSVSSRNLEDTSKEFSELKSHLNKYTSDLSDKQKQSCTMTATWGREVTQFIQNTLATEESRIEEFRQKIIEAVMTTQQSSLTSFIEGIQLLIHKLQNQVAELQNSVRNHNSEVKSGLQHLESMADAYCSEQQEKIGVMEQQITDMHQTDSTLNQKLEEQLTELQRTLKEKKSVFSDFTQKLKDDGQCRKTAVEEFSENLHRKVKSMDESSTGVCQFLEAGASETLQQNTEALIKMREGLDVCHLQCQKVSEQSTQVFLSSHQAWQENLNEFSNKVTEHTTSSNTDMNSQCEQLMKLQNDCTEVASKLMSSTESSNQELQTAVNKGKNLSSQQQQTVCDWSKSLSHDINTHSEEVRTFLMEEMEKDVPTGVTPQRREFTYPRVLAKTEEHDVLLEKFRIDSCQDPIVCNLAGALATADDGEQMPLMNGHKENTSESETSQDPPDNVSEAGSDTSAISSMSNFSESSNISKASEKENKSTSKKWKAPLTRSLKKGKSEKVNYTPRSKTRIPLSSSNTPA